MSMTRRQARELAFILLFEKSFTDESIEEIVEKAQEARDINANEFTMMLAGGAESQMEAIDEEIYAYSKKWKEGRISRVAMGIMRIAIYEMLFVDEIDESISINEAVELAKKYGGEHDPSYINGVLGGISRQSQNETQEPDKD